jgi:MFS family permease
MGVDAGEHLSLSDERTVVRAKRAVFVAFFSSGFAFASWASRIPQVKHTLRLDPGQLGLVLLSIAVGSVFALPLAGIVVTRMGPSRTIVAMSVVLATGMATAAVGLHQGVGLVVVGLFLLGFGNGTWDVAMNVEGAAVEQRLGRSVMSRFHAGWSLGSVGGALIGAIMVACHVGVTTHLLLVSGLLVLVVPYSVRAFLPTERGHDPLDRTERIHPLQAWTEPRTILIGLLVFSAAFVEGTGNDWLGVAVTDGDHAAAGAGALTLALFLGAMTSGRWFGSGLLDRYGRVPVLRLSMVAAATGLVLVAVGSSLPVAMAGALLWGVGGALGFPVGMSAAADEPARAAARVSTAASIGYVAFLAGPPLIGLLGDHLGVRHALIAAVGVLALGLLGSGACRPLEPAAE